MYLNEFHNSSVSLAVAQANIEEASMNLEFLGWSSFSYRALCNRDTLLVESLLTGKHIRSLH